MKRMLSLLLSIFLLLPLIGHAEEASLTSYQAQETELLASGLELFTETSFEWGNLPMLTVEENDVLKSLFAALKTNMRRQGVSGNGYTALDVYLQNVSVIDMAMASLDGSYIEASSLLGGQTVSFTKDEFAAFSKRVSQRSDDVLLASLDILYDVMLLALGGPDSEIVDMETLSLFLNAVEDWSDRALITMERQRPTVMLPGIYGERAIVRDISREEALVLASEVAEVLIDPAAEGTLIDALGISFPGEEESAVVERLKDFKAFATALPDAIAQLLPESMPPIEFREIINLKKEIISRQLEVSLPGKLALYIEWAMNEDVITDFYISAASMGKGASVLYTREEGVYETSGKVTQKLDRYVSEIRLFAEDFALNASLVRQENREWRADKEIITGHTELIMESEQLLGEGSVLTLLITDLGEASGEGIGYKRKTDRAFYLKGLGFDDQVLLKVSGLVVPREPAMPVDPAAAFSPAQYSDEMLDQWIEEVQVSFTQAGYTVLGRVPPTVAVYLLENVFGEAEQ